MPHRPPHPGEQISGTLRRRVALSSGSFAMIEDGLGFRLVPWRPALEQSLGKQVRASVLPGGRIDWLALRSRGPAR
jgi:hypothetical protein